MEYSLSIEHIESIILFTKSTVEATEEEIVEQLGMTEHMNTIGMAVLKITRPEIYEKYGLLFANKMQQDFESLRKEQESLATHYEQLHEDYYGVKPKRKPKNSP